MRFNLLEIWYWDLNNIKTILSEYLKKLSNKDSFFLMLRGGK